MTRISWQAALCAVLFSSVDVSAADTKTKAPSKPDETPDETASEPHNWSIGAGVDFDGPSVGTGGPPGGVAGVGALGGLAAPFGEPRLSVMLERRVAHPLWVLAKLSGGYATSHTDGPDSLTGLDMRHRSFGGEGAVGLRVVFTPDDPFQLSSFATIGMGYTRSVDEPTGGTPVYAGDGNTLSGGLRLGIALDRELIEGLGLRLSTVLGYAGYGRSSLDVFQGGAIQHVESDAWNAGITLSPSIELRFSF